MSDKNKAANGVAKNEKGEISTPQTPELSNLSVVAKVDKSTGELNQEQATGTAPTIEARLKKLEELQETVEKRETVVSALENLNKFYVSPSGGCNMKLTDSKGNSFGIAHPAVIGEMVHMAKAKLQDELTRLEDAINFSI